MMRHDSSIREICFTFASQVLMFWRAASSTRVRLRASSAVCSSSFTRMRDAAADVVYRHRRAPQRVPLSVAIRPLLRMRREMRTRRAFPSTESQLSPNRGARRQRGGG